MVSESRRRVEVAACGLLARHGYHGFGLKALSEAAGLPYGSIYHHFPGGKEEIAVAAITGTGMLAGRMIRQAPTDVFATTTTLFDFMIGKLAHSDWVDGCPIGTPALDGGSDIESVRAACVTAFETMEQAFAGLLAELGLSAQQAGELATTVIAAYEGATMLARVRRTEEPLHTVAAAMERLIRVTFTAAGLPKVEVGVTDSGLSGTGSSDIDTGMPAAEAAAFDGSAAVDDSVAGSSGVDRANPHPAAVDGVRTGIESPLPGIDGQVIAAAANAEPAGNVPEVVAEQESSLRKH